MTALRIRGLAYRALRHPLSDPRAPVPEIFAKLSRQIAAQTRAVTDGLTADERGEAIDHYLCSTIVDMCFSAGQVRWADLAAQPGAPQTFVNAYECASWGYALRHAFRKRPEARFALVSILDANVHNFEFWVYNPNWEHSGFGITTLLVERDPAVPADLLTGYASGGNPMMEFAVAVRRAAQARGGTTLSMPFFPAHIGAMLSRVLDKTDRLPDLHPRFGHCFGSDPWVGLLAAHDAAPVDGERKFLACSLALNGYHCSASVTLDPRAPRLWLTEDAK